MIVRLSKILILWYGHIAFYSHWIYNSLSLNPFFFPTADLITKADQLTNQRLLCVLEVCALGGDKVELVLNRAFPLR